MLTNFIFILILFLIISYSKTKDLFSPSCLVCTMFLFCSVFAYYASEDWSFTMGEFSFELLIMGLSSFLIVSFATDYFFRHLNQKKRINCSDIVPYYGPFKINKFFVGFIFVFFLMAAMYYFYSLVSVVGLNGFTMASSYRELMRSANFETGILTNISLYILRACSTVFTYIIVNNVFYKEFRVNKEAVLLFCVVIYSVLTLLSGERTSIVRIIGVAVLAYSIVWQRANYHKIIPIKTIFVGILSFIAILYVFSAIRYFVGRSSELELIDYLAFYFGTPIYNFDYGISNNALLIENSNHTFIGLYNNLARLGFGEAESIHRTNIVDNFNHIFFGNTYTCLYDYYVDFGTAGMTILMSFYSFIITWLYNSAVYAKRYVAFKGVIYIFFGTTMFFVAFTEQFYGTYIAFSSIVMLTIMSMILFLLENRVKIDRFKGD